MQNFNQAPTSALSKINTPLTLKEIKNIPDTLNKIVGKMLA